MLSAADVTARKVLEVGSRVVQGQDMTMRHQIEALDPARYQRTPITVVQLYRRWLGASDAGRSPHRARNRVLEGAGALLEAGPESLRFL